MRKRSLERGFTLLEVMVSLVIFCLLGVGTSSILLSLLRSQEAMEEEHARLETLQRLVMSLQHDISQAAPRLPDTTPNDAVHPYIQAAGPEMTFTSLNWRNPLDEPRSLLAYIHYAFAAGALTRQVWPLENTSLSQPALTHLLADNIGQVTFTGIPAKNSGSAAAAPASVPVSATPAPPPFPAAIDIRATLPPFGDVRLLVPMVQTP